MRLIDADALHYWTAEYCPTGLWISQFDISNAPAIEWIPVTERLPEEKREVLICTSGGSIYIGEYEKSTWADGSGTWTESLEYLMIHTVVAWMPLPEPYRR